MSQKETSPNGHPQIDIDKFSFTVYIAIDKKLKEEVLYVKK